MSDIGENVKEITANKTVLMSANNGQLLFEPYQKADDKTGFRCMARIVK